MVSTVKAALVPVDTILFHPHNIRRDYGDLRGLAASITRFGVMQPVVLETYGDRLRLRAGHRRVAAARLAGLTKVPAIVHSDALDDDEWLMASVHENAQRRALDAGERTRTITALRDHGCSWEGIAEAFGVTAATCRGWCRGEDPTTPRDEEKEGLREKVQQLSHDGRSNAQIADSIGISARQVVRIRTGRWRTTVGCSLLRTFIEAWRTQEASADDVLDALARLVDSAKLVDVLPHVEQDTEATA